jgi:hypothetical protein
VQVERIDVVSGKAFAEVVATLEKNAPIVESSALGYMGQTLWPFYRANSPWWREGLLPTGIDCRC